MRAHPRSGPSAQRWLVWGVGVLLATGAGCSRPQISVTVPLLPPLISPPKPASAWVELFDGTSLDPWREISVSGHTRYQLADLEGRQCLKAQSYGSASILLYRLDVDPDAHPWLSWAWRVDRLIAEEALERKDGSDAAARVYVYFKTKGLPWQKRNIDYVWSGSLPVGTLLESAYSPVSKIIVVESGAASLGQWRQAERNLEEDYRRCFGQEAPDVVAIGLMSDADNTRGETLAYFDDLRLTRRPTQPAAPGQ